MHHREETLKTDKIPGRLNLVSFTSWKVSQLHLRWVKMVHTCAFSEIVVVPMHGRIHLIDIYLHRCFCRLQHCGWMFYSIDYLSNYSICTFISLETTQNTPYYFLNRKILVQFQNNIYWRVKDPNMARNIAKVADISFYFVCVWIIWIT